MFCFFLSLFFWKRVFPRTKEHRRDVQAEAACVGFFFCETDHSNGAWHISSGWQYVLEVRVGVGTC